MNVVPFVLAFSGGIFFTIWLELMGLQTLLEPFRDSLSILSGLRN